MAIDRVGKGVPTNPASSTSETGSVERRGPADAPFSVGQAEGAKGVAKTADTDATSPLARLRAGEIDVNRYVDLTVDDATKGLQGLSTSQLDDIKKVLRDQVASDPALTDLVRAATGQSAAEPEE